MMSLTVVNSLSDVKIKFGGNWVGDICSLVHVNLICEFVCCYGIIGQFDG